MKKVIFRVMGLVLGLSVFTACYGPAPGWQYDEPEELSDETKAPEEEESAPAEVSAEGEETEAAE